MNQSLKVFLSCALGAFVGALVALQINHNFWWIGLVAGFVTGYLSYEFRTVIKAIPLAYRSATNWRPDKAWWQEYAEHIREAWFVGSGLVSGPVVLLMMIDLRNHIVHKSAAVPMLSLYGLAIWLSLGLYFGIGMGILTVQLERMKMPILGNRYFFYEFWFLDLPCLSYRALTLLPCGVRKLGGALKVCGNFAWHLFRMIHSEVRVLCGADAAVGAAIGYHFGNAIIGAVAGGLWGVLNFEIFSIRVLKCVPATRSLFH